MKGGRKDGRKKRTSDEKWQRKEDLSDRRGNSDKDRGGGTSNSMDVKLSVCEVSKNDLSEEIGYSVQ